MQSSVWITCSSARCFVSCLFHIIFVVAHIVSKLSNSLPTSAGFADCALLLLLLLSLSLSSSVLSVFGRERMSSPEQKHRGIHIRFGHLLTSFYFNIFEFNLGDPLRRVGHIFVGSFFLYVYVFMVLCTPNHGAILF